MSTPRNAVQVPAPVFDDGHLTEFLTRMWGIASPHLTRLGSERDLNVLINGTAILKVINPAEDRSMATMQAAALRHIAQSDHDLPIPSALLTVSGETFADITTSAGEDCTAWLVTRLPGADIEGTSIDRDLAYQMGATAAKTQRALQGFFHPAAGRVMGWDVRRLADYANLSDRLADLYQRVAPAINASLAMRAAVQHADITLSNVLFDTGANGQQSVSGVIDFGDMHHTAAICDLAVTLASVLRNTAPQQTAGVWELTAAVLDGYQQQQLLEPAEVAILGELVLARLGITEAIVGLHIGRDAASGRSNSHITRYLSANTRVWTELAAHSPADLAQRLGRLAGTSRAPLKISSATAGMTSPNSAPLLERRRDVMGGSLAPLFYEKPLHIVRGEGPWLITSEGRQLLDAYNNVAVIGHSHPAVTQSVSRQIATLNTHSRYLHGGIVELAERILATMPPELDTCLFTTSGTEANELAWRIATAYTGGRGAIVGQHAYHGSTKWMADLSPLEWPAGYHAPHVALFEAPHGPGSNSPESVAEQRVTQAAAQLLAAGEKPALVLADSLFTSEGILNTPDTFLRGLSTGAHGAGALYLADEVQAGYGRTGPQLWRFALADVVPDFVSLGKPMGNGYPVGALVTRRDLAKTLAADYEYFSTFAATPVAAAAALAVLDVLEDQQIPDQAAIVGEYLRGELRALRREHPAIGEVRGIGLLAGIDLIAPETADTVPISAGTVTDSAGAAPHADRTWARRLLNAMVERGVMAGLTGPTGTTLKVRPPLIWRREHVDLFITALDASLTDV